MKNQKTMGNKGFSLVELIVVIAIMVVLVAVLAPTFVKYVESSRRSTDVQNANSIADAIITDKTEDAGNGTKVTSEVDALTSTNQPSAVKTIPAVKGNVYKSGKFFVSYDESNNVAHVYIGTSTTDISGDLTTEDGAKAYKDE